MYMLLQLLDPRVFTGESREMIDPETDTWRGCQRSSTVLDGGDGSLSLGDLGAGAVYLADKANETLASAALPSPSSVAMNGALEDVEEA